jgi:hypothetical protein
MSDKIKLLPLNPNYYLRIGIKKIAKHKKQHVVNINPLAEKITPSNC